MNDIDDPVDFLISRKEGAERRRMERAELSHSEKVRAVFEKFDKDGDGRLNFHEACAYNLAKEGKLLDDATWAEVCGALGFSAAQGMGYEHFERMYDAYWVGRGGNDINVDYMRLCEDTKAEPKTTVTQNSEREEGMASESSERVKALEARVTELGKKAAELREKSLQAHKATVAALRELGITELLRRAEGEGIDRGSVDAATEAAQHDPKGAIAELILQHQMQRRERGLKKIRPRAGGGRRKKSKRRKTSKRRKSKTRRRRR